MFKDCDLILSVKEAENHDKWLEVRNQGLGGSDAGVIMGLNGYKDPYTLWAEKTGLKAPEDLSDNEAVYWGTENEPTIAKWFSKETGKKIQKMGTVQSKEYPFMLANVDRVIVGENAGLEIKTADSRLIHKWDDDEIPDAYYCQCLHYMAVTGADYWYIAVLIGGNKGKWKRIERNEEDIKTLIEAEKEFWEMIQTKTPPPVDGSKSCTDTLTERFSQSNGETVELPEEADSLIARITEDEAIAKTLEKQIDMNKNKLKEMMGEAEIGTVGSYKVTWKTTAGRESCTLSKIKENDEALYQSLKEKGFISTSKPSRRFSIKEVKE